MATSGNSCNLHKSKIATRTHLKIDFSATYLRMMYKTSLRRFSGMQSPFLMLNLQLQVKTMLKKKSRTPLDYESPKKVHLQEHF